MEKEELRELLNKQQKKKREMLKKRKEPILSKRKLSC